MEGHGFGIASRQHQARALAFLGADGAEDVGRTGALILGRGWPGAALGPAAGDLVLLPDAGFIPRSGRGQALEPELYVLALGFLGGDLRQLGGEVFLTAAMASRSWA